MEEWEFVEGPHYQSQSETGHTTHVRCWLSKLWEPIRDWTQFISGYTSQISSPSVSESEPPTTIMADRYMNIPLNQPSFNWDSTNMIAEWKRFRDQVELLLDGGPYTGMEEKQKLSTLLNWMTDKGQKIYKEQLISYRGTWQEGQK